jgi:quinoprotein glucose dehydrogenase
VAPLAGQAPVSGPVFTAQQADAGKQHYDTTCAPCHGSDLGGADAPALAGADFAKAWGSQTTADLFKYTQGMPPGGTPLADDDNLAVVAYLLQQNGAAAGAAPLQPTTAVKIGGIATGKRPPVALAVSHRR